MGQFSRAWVLDLKLNGQKFPDYLRHGDGPNRGHFGGIFLPRHRLLKGNPWSRGPQGFPPTAPMNGVAALDSLGSTRCSNHVGDGERMPPAGAPRIGFDSAMKKVQTPGESAQTVQAFSGEIPTCCMIFHIGTIFGLFWKPTQVKTSSLYIDR